MQSFFLEIVLFVINLNTVDKNSEPYKKTTTQSETALKEAI